LPAADIPVRCRAVVVFVLRRHASEWQTLLLQRVDDWCKGAWCPVTGGIDPGEAAWQTALRELREETGLVPDRFYASDACEQFYDARRDCIRILPVFVAFVDGEQPVTLDHEHGDHRWLGLAAAAEQVAFSVQREALLAVRRDFIEREPNELLRIDPATRRQS
jgi:dATP pyrophosphohydrolase